MPSRWRWRKILFPGNLGQTVGYAKIGGEFAHYWDAAFEFSIKRALPGWRFEGSEIMATRAEIEAMGCGNVVSGVTETCKCLCTITMISQYKAKQS
jgi:hypothetical protein